MGQLIEGAGALLGEGLPTADAAAAVPASAGSADGAVGGREGVEGVALNPLQMWSLRLALSPAAKVGMAAEYDVILLPTPPPNRLTLTLALFVAQLSFLPLLLLFLLLLPFSLPSKASATSSTLCTRACPWPLPRPRPPSWRGLWAAGCAPSGRAPQPCAGISCCRWGRESGLGVFMV